MAGKLNFAGAGLIVAVASLSLVACNKPADKAADASAAPAADAAAPAATPAAAPAAATPAPAASADTASAAKPSGSLTQGEIKDPDQTAKTAPTSKP